MVRAKRICACERGAVRFGDVPAANKPRSERFQWQRVDDSQSLEIGGYITRVAKRV
jgi:hypothetical protein